MKKLFLPLLLVMGITAKAQVKIGNNPTTIGTSSVLELENPNKAFLLTRVAKVSDVAIPAEGMIVYDISRRCLRDYENGIWTPCLSGTPTTTNYIPGGVCTGALISRTSCKKVAGAILNDDPTTTGIEYDVDSVQSNNLGQSLGSPANSRAIRAIIEINEQCWPTTNIGANGRGGYGSNYKWSDAMAGNGTERSQGVCPTLWHVASNCEWLFLMNSVGINASNVYNAGGTGGRILLVGGSSGFYAPKNGINMDHFNSDIISSTWTSTTGNRPRGPEDKNFILMDDANVEIRTDFNYYYAQHPVRCIKD